MYYPVVTLCIVMVLICYIKTSAGPAQTVEIYTLDNKHLCNNLEGKQRSKL